jgi:hypothetical protein
LQGIQIWLREFDLTHASTLDGEPNQIVLFGYGFSLSRYGH